MITQYYQCTLKTDLVLNQSLATEGNVSSLDYIPGSVFMGIVANGLYKAKKDANDIYTIVHANQITFGDAMIGDGKELSFHMPFYLYKEKLNEDSPVYLHHFLVDDGMPKDENGNEKQLKQQRQGYFNLDGVLFKVQKSFAQKSARDSKTRKSADEKMFGFEAIKAGQVFMFPIHYKDEKFINEVEAYLLGNKRVGKSKTAQYAQVSIEKLNSNPNHEFKNNKDFALVYANSHLCFLDELGQPKLEIEANDLSLGGKINWEKSQVRTYTYTSWNGKRNTPNTQRHCIARGSVFYVENNNSEVEGKQAFVGEYQNEGLGNILINPTFLFDTSSDKNWNIQLQEPETITQKNTEEINGKLSHFLNEKKKGHLNQLELSQKIVKALNDNEANFKNISKSQWGMIRQKASSVENINDECTITQNNDAKKAIEGSEFEFITKGVAYDKQWSKNNNLKDFMNLIHGKTFQFIAKFASQKAKNKNNND